MSHDKIRAAARRRMTETGESYAAARRAVIREYQAPGTDNPLPGTQWFAISFSDAGLDRLTLWLDTLFGGGPGRSGAEIGPDKIQVRMGAFKQDVPRSSVRSASMFRGQVGGTTGVHASQGRLLVNGSANDLVELRIDPPCYTGRTMSTMYIKERVSSLVLSLEDPGGFIAAVQGDRAPKA